MSRLIPEPRLSHHDANGKPFPGALCATYFSQTSNPAPVYKDSALSIAHTNPVVADDLGRFPVMYGAAGVELKFILTDSDGGNTRTIDPATPFVLTQDEVGRALYDITAAEEAAGVTVVNFAFPPLNEYRYGFDGTGSTADATARAAVVAVAAELTSVNQWQTGLFVPGYPQSAAELAVSLVPTNARYPAGDLWASSTVARYGAAKTAPATVNNAAIQSVLHSQGVATFGRDPLNISTPIMFEGDGQALIGAGRSGGTVLTWTGSANSSIIANSNQTVRNHIAMRDLRIDFSADGCTGIDASHFSYSSFQRIHITANGNNTRGIYMIGRTGDRPYYNEFDQIDMASNNIGGTTSGSVGYYLDRVAVGENYNGPNANRYHGGRIYGFDTLCRMLDGNGNVFREIVGESIKVAHYDFGSSTGDKIGTATSGTINTLVNSGGAFTAGVYIGGACEITGGTGAGQIRHITGNTTTAVTVFPYWRVIPDNTSVYKLYINQGLGNVIRDCYAEGDAPSNPNFLKIRPGVLQTRLEGGTIGSLGTGAVVAVDCPRVDDVFTPNTWQQAIPLTFYALDLAASQMNLALAPAGWTRNNLQTAYSWAVIAIDSSCSGVITAGSCQISVTDNGTKINGSTADVLMNSGNTFNANGGSQRSDVFSQTAIVGGGQGRGLGLVVTTDGSWSPTNSDLHVTLWVQRR